MSSTEKELREKTYELIENAIQAEKEHWLQATKQGKNKETLHFVVEKLQAVSAKEILEHGKEMIEEVMGMPHGGTLAPEDYAEALFHQYLGTLITE